MPYEKDGPMNEKPLSGNMRNLASLKQCTYRIMVLLFPVHKFLEKKHGSERSVGSDISVYSRAEVLNGKRGVSGTRYHLKFKSSSLKHFFHL